MSVRRAVAALGVLAVLLAACGRSGRRDGDDPPPVRPAWQPLTLPAPPGPPGRLMLRDATTCAGRWYVVGAVGDPSGGTRPAAWTSADGVTFAAVPTAPRTYYGRQHVLYSVACRDGRMAVLGAKRGGAHANPRTSSWRQSPDGSLGEVTAPFELFGGPRAVDVARMVAGDTGWLITGNRTSGAAVWGSADSARFTIAEGAPELASDRRGETWNFDAVATGAGWLSVGGIVAPGRTDRDPLAWTSVDGVTWRRVPVPGTGAYDELQRVVLVDGVPVAVGLRGRAFGVWRAEGAGPGADGSGAEGPGADGPSVGAGRPDGAAGPGAGGWRAIGGFGVGRADGVPGVRGLVVSGGRLFAATTDGVVHALWMSADGGDSWGAVAGPVPMPAGAERAVAVTGAGDRLLLTVDDGVGSRAFLAPARDR